MQLARGKNNAIYTKLLFVFLITFIALMYAKDSKKEVMEIDTAGLARINAINSGVQRVTKLELENIPNDELTIKIYYMMLMLYPFDEGMNYFDEFTIPVYFNGNDEMLAIIKEYTDEFMRFIDTIGEYRSDNVTRDTLFEISENYYEISTQTAHKVDMHIAEMQSTIDNMAKVLYGNFFVLVVLLFIIMTDKSSELNKSKKISQEMNLDYITGVYNREKSSKILNKSTKYKALATFEVDNIIGNTNGNELLCEFARVLKDSARVFEGEMMITRYKDDEFVVYFTPANEEQIRLYIDEISFLVRKHNQIEMLNSSRGNSINFSFGYSLIDRNKTENMKLRGLLAEAESMMRR